MTKQDQGRISTPAFSVKGHFNGQEIKSHVVKPEVGTRPVSERNYVQSPATEKSFRAVEFGR